MSAIQRHVYRAHGKPGCAAQASLCFRTHAKDLKRFVAAGQLLTVSVFASDDIFFVYYETLADVLSPKDLFGNVTDLLQLWPGQSEPRAFVPMMDIFHCAEPASLEHWRRKQPVQQYMGRMARLNPEWYSRYIFYHYQLQEEQPGSFDKYGLISVHEEVMFFYQELPPIIETPPKPGALSTKNTPDHWQDVMFPHFQLWDQPIAGQEIWKDMTLILQVSPITQVDSVD